MLKMEVSQSQNVPIAAHAFGNVLGGGGCVMSGGGALLGPWSPGTLSLSSRVVETSEAPGSSNC